MSGLRISTPIITVVNAKNQRVQSAWKDAIQKPPTPSYNKGKCEEPKGGNTSKGGEIHKVRNQKPRFTIAQRIHPPPLR